MERAAVHSQDQQGDEDGSHPERSRSPGGARQAGLEAPGLITSLDHLVRELDDLVLDEEARPRELEA
jgi:hypothetical protein